MARRAAGADEAASGWWIESGSWGVDEVYDLQSVGAMGCVNAVESGCGSVAGNLGGCVLVNGCVIALSAEHCG